MNIAKQNKTAEIICFCLFIICTIFVSFYHEPWYDELQAWAISKDTLYNILFVIPHYEGHPPLWHLILKIFSLLKINLEIGMRIPNFIFIYSAIWLLIFKSPFPKILKLILPFTYFLFYQYAVISRPYSIYCFAIFLAALFYKDKNEHPYKFVIALALMSLTGAFGMVIAVGIIIVWFIEIIKQRDFSIKAFFKDNRFYLMFIMFLICLYIVCTIFPAPDVFYAKNFTILSVTDLFFIKTLYNLFILPCDSLFTNYSNSMIELESINLLICFLGICTYILLFKILKAYKSLMLFFIPYLMFIVFAFKYIEVHHFGLLTIFYIFVFWCILDKDNSEVNCKYNKPFNIFLVITILMQLYWSIYAYINDYKYNYWFGREIVSFIKENQLENYKIISDLYGTSYYQNKKTGQKIGVNVYIPDEYYDKFAENWQRYNLVLFGTNIVALTVNTYLDKNIFKNFNMDNPDKNYVIMKKINEKQMEETSKKITALGMPEIYIGNLNILDMIYPSSDIENTKYDLVKISVSYIIFKNSKRKQINTVYIRKDVNEKLKLPVITKNQGNYD